MASFGLGNSSLYFAKSPDFYTVLKKTLKWLLNVIFVVNLPFEFELLIDQRHLVDQVEPNWLLSGKCQKFTCTLGHIITLISAGSGDFPCEMTACRVSQCGEPWNIEIIINHTLKNNHFTLYEIHHDHYGGEFEIKAMRHVARHSILSWLDLKWQL